MELDSKVYCYGRPLFQAWLLPDLNTIPNNCVRVNSLSVFGRASLVQILSESYISAMHLFICFFVTDFVRKMWARSGLAIEPLIPFSVQKWTSYLIRLPVINK